jgi:hypothetical protein
MKNILKKIRKSIACGLQMLQMYLKIHTVCDILIQLWSHCVTISFMQYFIDFELSFWAKRLIS